MSNDRTLDGRIVLVVEDEYFIASDLKRALAGRGAIVLGPTGSLDEGLRLAETIELDIAVLDVNLGEATSFPIASRLAERGVPWTFLTGYDEWALPDRYRDAPRVTKPFRTAAVLDTVTDLLTERIL